MSVTLPPQLQLFLELIRPLRDSFHVRYTHKSTLPDEATADFSSYIAHLSDTLSKLLDALDKQVNRKLNAVVMSDHATWNEIQLEINKLDRMLGELLSEYLYASRQIVSPDCTEGQRLLLSIMRHILTQIKNWLDDIVETLEDPVAACQKRGLPTSGKVEITLTVDITPPKLLAELKSWTDNYVVRKRREIRATQRAASQGGGFWEVLLGLWIGSEILEHLFGKNKD